MRQLSIIDPSHQKEINMYLMESTSYVERPSLGPAQFSYPSVQCTGLISKEKMELSCSPPRRIPFSPRHRPTQKERAQSPGLTCRSANVKRRVEPELANRSNFRNRTSYS
ncbi:hypothetical protein LI410_mgp049 (mitochondrion) [Apium graveolens]|uniref:hypothetical protein n=1 Tax=Apium graveolens TaxID=4045 RepID=UPI001D0255C5|nr:hypothetical protein LI410_mgp129 [Apium graveolens]YP_010185177.1 hypothetical protein LI410_mgp049 [Apium graveolens]QVJ97855.1 hypothetical protein [Apium graveolens]QVJ97934.1 hypothetical protein [Apium graveolens]QVJ98017.1 hypothetical protein [Apium graveolens]QVJ98086.1 hypothetical protein [Apium graveolens]